MSRKKARSKVRETSRHRPRSARRRRAWWIAGVVGLTAAAAVVWYALLQSGTAPSGSGLPGPAGGRDVAQDVNTLVGRPAPSFTLATAEGAMHTVTPGRGRPTVLIFHMGVT